jgi:mannose-6-phosphate isomerase-like protein (cupin superfamily)
VYAVVRGAGTVVVDGEKVPVGSGQFIAVAADSARHIRAGDSGLIFSAVCAAPASADGFHGAA